MRKHLSSHTVARRNRDTDVALWLAVPLALTLTLATGCGSDKDTNDGGTCQAPNVWRYQTPGCGAEAHPVCGSASQDAGLGYACGCDGEILIGFDYFKKPWSARGICPDACISPSNIIDIAGAMTPVIKGCACNPTTDGAQCVSAYGGMHPMSCVAGQWNLDRAATCTAPVDGSIDARDGGRDGGTDATDGALPLADGPIDEATDGGGTCQAPNVWRYQTAGCDAEANPVCGSAMQDAGLGFACGCDGEILVGFDYFSKPWSARGICPDACISPTHIIEVAGSMTPVIKGCACNSSTDGAQCVSAFGGMHPISCVAGQWSLDRAATCIGPVVDGGTDTVDSAMDGVTTGDGGACAAPNVWRYQTPGCGAEAHPVCGSASQDAGLGFACGCDGEILSGFDYFTKPYSARGICPDACNSPTHIIEVYGAVIKGCSCNSTTDGPACVSAFGGMHPMTCVSGQWNLDRQATCTGTQVDGGAVDGGVGG